MNVNQAEEALLQKAMTTDLSGTFQRVNERWTSQSEETALQKYILSYLMITTPKALTTQVKNIECETIEVQKIDPANKDSALKFIVENYYLRFPDHYDQYEIDQFLSAAESYFALEVAGRTYIKDGAIVGCILTNRMLQYPTLDGPTNHVGYWGCEYETLDPLERDFIKHHWFKHLVQFSQEGDLIDLSVAVFNPRAFKFSERLGFQITSIRFDKKARGI